MEFGGVRLIGLTAETGARVLLTAAVIGVVLVIRIAVLAIVRGASRTGGHERLLFWTRQGTSLAALALALVATISIWFDSTARLASVAGFVTAGLAIAAQRVVTAFAGYLIIMRGKAFTVGDRIKMGGVRGDVIALGFLQTRIMEMGQPPDVNEQETPGMWVRARQFSGRIVTVTNDKVFDDPIYNFTRELPFIWEEISVGVPYGKDRARAETILIGAAREFAGKYASESEASRSAFQVKYHVQLDRPEPRVYWRLTDNWLELTVRFLVPEHGIRDVKDGMSRRILREFDAARLDVASTNMDIRITGVPPVRVAPTDAAGD